VLSVGAKANRIERSVPRFMPSSISDRVRSKAL
jgi:hypothetical protein